MLQYEITPVHNEDTDTLVLKVRTFSHNSIKATPMHLYLERTKKKMMSTLF